MRKISHITYNGTFNGKPVSGEVRNAYRTSIEYSAHSVAAAVYRAVTGGKSLSRRSKNWSMWLDRSGAYVLGLGRYGTPEYDRIEFRLVFDDVEPETKPDHDRYAVEGVEYVDGARKATLLFGHDDLSACCRWLNGYTTRDMGGWSLIEIRDTTDDEIMRSVEADETDETEE